MIAVLLALAPIPVGLFGVELGVRPEVAIERFAPVGQTAGGAWSRTSTGDAIMWRCEAAKRCFAVPSSAVFYVVDGVVASVALTVEAGAAPPEQTAGAVLTAAEVSAKLGPPAATAAVVDRRVRYFLGAKHTIVWAQDGADAEIKVSLDALDPVGRAEAVAAGADAKLDALPGAADYAAAHAAIGKRDWPAAEGALERVVGNAKAAVALQAQARLVLAMAIAARVKAGGAPADNAGKAAAKAALARAAGLAPDLAKDLGELAQALGL